MTPPGFKNQHFGIRLRNAWRGLVHCWREEHSFRTHVWLGGLAVVGFALLGVAWIWWALVALCIGVILAAEAFNSALEALIDHLHPELHPTIGRVKDSLAGAVLILSAMALIVAILAWLDTVG